MPTMIDDSNPFAMELAKRIRSLKKKIGKIDNLYLRELDELDKDQIELVSSKPALEAALKELSGLALKFEGLEETFAIVDTKVADEAAAAKAALAAEETEKAEADKQKADADAEAAAATAAKPIRVNLFLPSSGGQETSYTSVDTTIGATVGELLAASSSSPRKPVPAPPPPLPPPPAPAASVLDPKAVEALCELIFVSKFFPAAPEKLHYVCGLVLGTSVYPGMTFADALAQSKSEAAKYVLGGSSVASNLAASLKDLSLESLDEPGVMAAVEASTTKTSNPTPPSSTPPIPLTPPAAPVPPAAAPAASVTSVNTSVDTSGASAAGGAKKREKRRAKKGTQGAPNIDATTPTSSQPALLPPRENIVATEKAGTAPPPALPLSFGFFGNETAEGGGTAQSRNDMNELISFGSLHDDDADKARGGSSIPGAIKSGSSGNSNLNTQASSSSSYHHHLPSVPMAPLPPMLTPSHEGNGGGGGSVWAPNGDASNGSQKATTWGGAQQDQPPGLGFVPPHSQHQQLNNANVSLSQPTTSALVPARTAPPPPAAEEESEAPKKKRGGGRGGRGSDGKPTRVTTPPTQQQQQQQQQNQAARPAPAPAPAAPAAQAAPPSTKSKATPKGQPAPKPAKVPTAKQTQPTPSKVRPAAFAPPKPIEEAEPKPPAAAGPPLPSPSVATAVAGKGGKEGGGVRGKMACHSCGQEGHKAAECPKKPPPSSGKGAGVAKIGKGTSSRVLPIPKGPEVPPVNGGRAAASNVEKRPKSSSNSRCHMCGEEGHQQAQCPHAKVASKAAAAAAAPVKLTAQQPPLPKHPPASSPLQGKGKGKGKGASAGKGKGSKRSSGSRNNNGNSGGNTGWDAPVTSVAKP